MTPRARRRRRILIASVVLVALAAGVALAVLALPLLKVQDHAVQARTELVAAKSAITHGKPGAAGQHIARARDAVNRAEVQMDTVGTQVWGALPFAGTAVDDVRRLVSALDHATSMGDIGIEVYPQLTGRDARLFDGERIDPGALRRVIARGQDLGEEALAADSELDEVQATFPFLGPRIDRARDQAAEVIGPVADGYRTVKPLLPVLPQALGTEGHVSYLIAIMNPAELRWSGGTVLSTNLMEIDRGHTKIGPQVDLSDVASDVPFVRWKPVPGNVFHYPGTDRLANATFNPHWPVSARELQRAWAAATGNPPVTGVIAVDLPALADLLEVTGPLQVAGYGQVTSQNLVEVLAGSYDDVDADQVEVRRQLNAQLARVFRDRLLSSGNLVAKGRVLRDAARGRHLAFWSSQPEVQDSLEHLGVSGALGDAGHDYLGVFTQNANSSKADYWLDRRLESRVLLDDDGSAQVELTVSLHNDSPPYAQPGEDPGTGYWTRYNTVDLLQMLPEGAVLRELVTPDDHSATTRTWQHRPFYRRRVALEPGEQVAVRVRYEVPEAASESDGRLSYRLVYDPQGLVRTQALRVHVVFPDGWSAEDLPQGWVASEDGAVLDAGRLDSTGSWRIDLTR